jgi:hypothetical protein
MLPAGSEGRLHRCSPLISHSKCVSVSSSGQMEDAACTADDDLSSHVSHTLGKLHDGIRRLAGVIAPGRRTETKS